MIELERTFLLKSLPPLSGAEKKEVMDIYIPSSSRHPNLRIRKDGNRMEMTKKTPLGKDHSVQKEDTISLTQEEFEELASLAGKRLRKMRHVLRLGVAEVHVDAYQDGLKGLVLADFEFRSLGDKDSFQPPGFCLVEVTQEEWIAGGMLAGKSYANLKPFLEKLGYEPLG